MIRYTCVKCGATLESVDSLGGGKDTCPICGTVCQVPLSKAQRAAAGHAAGPSGQASHNLVPPQPQAPSPVSAGAPPAQSEPTDALNALALAATVRRVQPPDALMHCPDCGQLISRYAASCPHCGAPILAAFVPSHRPVPRYVPSHLAGDIFVTLLCCVPFGIVGIVYASQVGSRLAAGDYAGATRASNNANTWNMIALLMGLLGGVLWFAATVSMGRM